MVETHYGSTFEGEWIDDGVEHGHGIETFIDGSCYCGMYILGDRHGQGTMTEADGTRFDGIWYKNILFIDDVNISFLINTIKLSKKVYNDVSLLSQRLQIVINLKAFIFDRIEAVCHRPGTLSTTLETILKCASPQYINSFVNDFVRFEPERWNILILAARNGFYNVVEILLKKFNVNIEIEGCVDYDSIFINGATALWCAAASGHLNIAELLVRYGADVNHHTRTNSGPLRAACFDGKYKIVKFLTEHGANVNLKKVDGTTNLILSVYYGHLNVVDLLLKAGADPNITDYTGCLALHYACEQGHLDIVKLLLDDESRRTQNACGHTPLMTAAMHSQPLIVEYLVSHCSYVEYIEALEILAASYCNDGVDDFEQTYKFLLKAMQLRYADPLAPVVKPILPVIAAYNDRAECQTIDQLENIRYDTEALRIETLLIRERILGVHSNALHYSIRHRGETYRDAKKFDQCLKLWLRACELKQITVKKSLEKDMKCFESLFMDMLAQQIKISTDILAQVLNIIIEEVQRNRQRIKGCLIDKEKKQQEDEYESNCYTSLYMVAVIAKVHKAKVNIRRRRIPCLAATVIGIGGCRVAVSLARYRSCIGVSLFFTK
ncbi:unnamed protein product [Didymodactylos carnosus]|uniref:Uncharacterized protein n=1 Tax=Didymodactylos carnosus TaxID=1234261 RepID=A0A815KJU1_9BILA|nr:unnamed protein product [Didymodactylos carnosus]CAF4290863.1 unnamed protein product [Didymodactylos carnosus]